MEKKLKLSDCSGCNCGKIANNETELSNKSIAKITLTTCKHYFKPHLKDGKFQPEDWEFCYMHKNQICNTDLCTNLVYIENNIPLIKLIKLLDTEAINIREQIKSPKYEI